MGRQIREKNDFLNFEPAAKIIYFRKTKNRISIMTCVDLLYTFLKIILLVMKFGESNSMSGVSVNRNRFENGLFGAMSANKSIDRILFEE